MEVQQTRIIHANQSGIWLALLYRHVQLCDEIDYRRAYHRAHFRYDLDAGAVRLSYVDTIDHTPPKAIDRWAAIIQLSPGGLMVRAQRPIADDTPLRLEIALEDEIVHAEGRVAHCTQTVGGYKIGIELVFSEDPQS